MNVKNIKQAVTFQTDLNISFFKLFRRRENFLFVSLTHKYCKNMFDDGFDVKVYKMLVTLSNRILERI